MADLFWFTSDGDYTLPTAGDSNEYGLNAQPDTVTYRDTIAGVQFHLDAYSVTAPTVAVNWEVQALGPTDMVWSGTATFTTEESVYEVTLDASTATSGADYYTLDRLLDALASGDTARLTITSDAGNSGAVYIHVHWLQGVVRRTATRPPLRQMQRDGFGGIGGLPRSQQRRTGQSSLRSGPLTIR